MQLAGVAVGSPIPLGAGGTFTGTFPAPQNGGTYVVRTDYTPTGAPAPVASYATNLVVNGGSGGTAPLNITAAFGSGANGQPPANLTLSLDHGRHRAVPFDYICTEHSDLACTITECFCTEQSSFWVAVASARSCLACTFHLLGQFALYGSMHTLKVQDCVHGIDLRFP